jgi:hypothetical protein
MDQTLELDNGARQIRAFIDRLGERRARVLVFALIAKAALAAALVWAAVLAAWLLIGRESPAAQTLLTATGAAPPAGATGGARAPCRGSSARPRGPSRHRR